MCTPAALRVPAAAMEGWAQGMWAAAWCKQIGYFSVRLTGGTGGC